MVLNINKCHMRSFSKYHCGIGFTDCLIESSNFEKDLGVFISSDLSWNIQIANACRKKCQSLQVLTRSCSPKTICSEVNSLQINSAAKSQLKFSCLVC